MAAWVSADEVVPSLAVELLLWLWSRLIVVSGMGSWEPRLHCG